MQGVVVCWIGERAADHRLMDAVCAHLQDELREPVRPGFEPERPAEAYDPRRRQHETSRILRWLEERHPEGEKVLAVTDVDLFIPILTFVFGEAQLGGRAAVVSTARLFPDGVARNGGTLLLDRLLKEALHEIGHAYGLVHCGTRACVMGRSPGVTEIDTKGNSFCTDCRLLFDESRRHAR